MKSNNLILTLALAALLGMAAVASAGPGPRGGVGPGPDFSQLTPEKQEIASQLFDEHRDAMTDLREDVWAKHLELDALVNSGNATKKDIQALVQDIKELRSKMTEERDSFRAELEEKTGLTMGFGGPGGRGGCGGYGNYGGGQGYGRHDGTGPHSGRGQGGNFSW